MLLPRRALKPRTYRTGAGTTLLIGGVARVDILDAPSATIYLTLWASDEVSTHLGRTDSADDRCLEIWGFWDPIVQAPGNVGCSGSCGTGC
jgi:hypothetical protein